MPPTKKTKSDWFNAYCEFIETDQPIFFRILQSIDGDVGEPDDKANYEFISRLSEGTFGGYYLARQREQQRLVVVKQMSKEMLVERDQQQNAVTERSFISSMSSPFVAKYIHRFRDSQNIYLVLEYAACGDLTRFYAANQPNRQKLAEKKLVPYIAQVVLALHFIHAVGITHRCLRPAKCLLTEKGRVKLTDFQYATSRTGEDDFVGDPPYCPPEMYLDRPCGRSVDFWALGVLIYKVALDEFPFLGGTRDEVRSTILTSPPAGIDEIAMSASLKDLLSKLLVKEPSERLGSGETDALEVFKHQWFSDIVPSDAVANLGSQKLTDDCFKDEAEYKHDMPDFHLKPVQGEPVAADLFSNIAPENLAQGWVGWRWF